MVVPAQELQVPQILVVAAAVETVLVAALAVLAL
jgi:hypothetical protein